MNLTAAAQIKISPAMCWKCNKKADNAAARAVDFPIRQPAAPPPDPPPAIPKKKKQASEFEQRQMGLAMAELFDTLAECEDGSPLCFKYCEEILKLMRERGGPPRFAPSLNPVGMRMLGRYVVNESEKAGVPVGDDLLLSFPSIPALRYETAPAPAPPFSPPAPENSVAHTVISNGPPPTTTAADTRVAHLPSLDYFFCGDVCREMPELARILLHPLGDMFLRARTLKPSVVPTFIAYVYTELADKLNACLLASKLPPLNTLEVRAGGGISRKSPAAAAGDRKMEIVTRCLAAKFCRIEDGQKAPLIDHLHTWLVSYMTECALSMGVVFPALDPGKLYHLNEKWWKGHTVCAHCGKHQGDLKRCGGCLLVRYCSAACQLESWKKHGAVCASYHERRVQHFGTKRASAFAKVVPSDGSIIDCDSD